MKGILPFIALFFFVVACNDDNAKNTEPVDTFPYDGTWTGRFDGSDYGTFSLEIDEKGDILGTAFTERLRVEFSLEGTVNANGEITASNSSNGAVFEGVLKADGTTSTGTWANGTAGGTWTASRQP